MAPQQRVDLPLQRGGEVARARPAVDEELVVVAQQVDRVVPQRGEELDRRGVVLAPQDRDGLGQLLQRAVERGAVPAVDEVPEELPAPRLVPGGAQRVQADGDAAGHRVTASRRVGSTPASTPATIEGAEARASPACAQSCSTSTARGSAAPTGSR
jgi:hypothetical protein